MTLNLPLLYVLWLEEYCQTSPNKNKSPNLWHVRSILVFYIFGCGYKSRVTIYFFWDIFYHVFSWPQFSMDWILFSLIENFDRLFYIVVVSCRHFIQIPWYSSNKITKTQIQISHQNWNGLFSIISHQMTIWLSPIVSKSKSKGYKRQKWRNLL